MEKDKRISAEKRRLTRLYKNLEENKKAVAAGLIERAAFMRVELEDMEADLKENGWTDLFQQGTAPAYERARPLSQSYQTLNSNYQKIIKQLSDLLPDTKGLTVTKAGESLAAFVAAGKPAV